MSANYTTIIRGARIVDGSGEPWRYGDVALVGDRIARVAPPVGMRGMWGSGALRARR